MIQKWIFIFILFFISCSDEEEKTETLYNFPPLSQGQLIDLKKQSEKIEGFFITTNLSDLDSSWAERGLYIYVCIRFLNDQTVNEQLNRSAIPLLVQVSNHQDRPEAESLLLFHPKTIKPNKTGIFYYEERKSFTLTDSSIVIQNKEYNIFDVMLNEKRKITELSFIKKGIKLEDLNRPFADPEAEDEENGESDEGEGGAGEEENNDEENNDESEGEADTGDEDGAGENDNEEGDEDEKPKDAVLGVKAFAKQFSSSCTDWAILNYKHSKEWPDYLNVPYNSSGDAGQRNIEGTTPNPNPNNGSDVEPQEEQPPGGAPNSSGDASAGADIPPQDLISENAPYQPLPQN